MLGTDASHEPQLVSANVTLFVGSTKYLIYTSIDFFLLVEINTSNLTHPFRYLITCLITTKWDRVDILGHIVTFSQNDHIHDLNVFSNSILSCQLYDLIDIV